MLTGRNTSITNQDVVCCVFGKEYYVDKDYLRWNMRNVQFFKHNNRNWYTSVFNAKTLHGCTTSLWSNFLGKVAGTKSKEIKMAVTSVLWYSSLWTERVPNQDLALSHRYGLRMEDSNFNCSEEIDTLVCFRMNHTSKNKFLTHFLQVRTSKIWVTVI